MLLLASQVVLSGATTSGVLSGSGSTQLLFLDSFEKVEYADVGDWAASATVKLAKSQTTGYVVSLLNDDDMPTGDFTTVYKMVPITVSVASYSGGQTGTFYDALVPLESANLSGTEYVYAEYTAPASAGAQSVDFVQSGTTITLSVTVFNYTLAESSVKLYAGLGNSFIWTGHHGEYASPAEILSLDYAPLAVTHRFTPYDMYVYSEVPISAGRLDYDAAGGFDFTTYVLDFVAQDFRMPGQAGDQTYLEAAESAVTTDAQAAWWYTWDEPSAGNQSALETRLTNEATYAPTIKSMVTTDKDYGMTPEPDIYCPVIDNFDRGGKPVESAYSADELWLYTSCMEHGCGQNRNSDTEAAKVSGTATGTAGLVIDHPVAYIYAFILLPIKYTTVTGLLYYHMVEGYQLYDDTPAVDVWTDQFNFGGNGDGTLFYPLRPGMYGSSTHQPAVSMRMKKVRDAMQLLDYAKAAGAASITTCSGGDLITDTDTWEATAGPWETFRSCLITELGF